LFFVCNDYVEFNEFCCKISKISALGRLGEGRYYLN